MARKPIPQELKQLTGTDQPCRRRELAPPSEPVDLASTKPPKFLKGAGRATWNQLLPLLCNTNVLGMADLPMFALYCQIQGKVIDDFRRDVPVPASMIAVCLSYASDFGLTPAARGRLRIGAGGKKAENPFEHFGRANARKQQIQ